MSIVIRNAEMRKVRESRNLRGILAHSRANKVARVDLFSKDRTRGIVGILWVNGYTTTAGFASFAVMHEWVSHRRAFKGATITDHSQEL